MGKKIYNKLKRTFTELKEGESLCKTCHGEGMVRCKRDYKGLFKKGALLVCKDCLGYGKLDWIENVVGKKPYHYNNIFKCNRNREVYKIEY